MSYSYVTVGAAIAVMVRVRFLDFFFFHILFLWSQTITEVNMDAVAHIGPSVKHFLFRLITRWMNSVSAGCGHFSLVLTLQNVRQANKSQWCCCVHNHDSWGVKRRGPCCSYGFLQRAVLTFDQSELSIIAVNLYKSTYGSITINYLTCNRVS